MSSLSTAHGSADAAPPTPPRFWWLWTASSAANLGDGLAQFALPLLALQLSSRPSQVAGLSMMLSLPWLLAALPAGSLVDRVNRRRLIQAVNLSRIVLLLLLVGLLSRSLLTLPLLYAIALLLGLGETLADTALTALVPATVPPARLGSANAALTGAQTVTNTFVGPPLAGTLASLGLGLVSLVGGLAYGVAAAALALVRDGAPPSSAAVRPRWSWAEMLAGLRTLWQQRLLRQLTLFTAAMNVCWGAWGALFLPYAVGAGPLGLTPFGYSLLLAAMAIGSLLGSALCTRLRRWLSLRTLLAVDLVGTMALVGVPALTSELLAVGAALAFAGAGAAIWVILVATLRQQLIPESLLGRAYSAHRMVTWGIGPLSALAAGLAADQWGIRPVFLVGALLSGAALILFLRTVRPADLQGAATG